MDTQEHPQPQVERSVSFFSDFVDLVYGVLFNPTATLRAVAGRTVPPVAVGVCAYLVAAFISGLAAGGSLAQAVRQMSEDMVPFMGMPPASVPGVAGQATGGYALVAAFMTVLIGPALLFIKTGVLALSSSIFGGRGDGRYLLAAFGLTYVPALLTVPVNLLLTGRSGVGVLGSLFVFLILVWRLVLDIIAMREVYALSTGRAAAAALVPLGVGVLLVFLALLFSIGLAFSVIGPLFETGLPGVG